MASVQAAAAAPSAQEPPAKRQKVIDSTDRLELDVGGTKFVTTATTLKDHSAYFASLLSDNWADSRDRDEGAIFLDRDPIAFGKLLAYMRRGIIKIEDVDVDVMTLAEFLGIEQLLRAIKIRWYINIGKGPVHSDDDEIAASFDREHGGILKALSSGLFCHFLSRNEVDPEKDYATLTVLTPGGWEESSYTVQEAKGGEAGEEYVCSGGIVGALNGLYARGYVLDDDLVDDSWPLCDTYTVKFSRRSHSAMHDRAMPDIFVPTNDEVAKQRGADSIKQIALLLKDELAATPYFFAPSGFGNDSGGPFGMSLVSEANGHDTSLWLDKHNFVTREQGLEEHGLIKRYLKFLREEFDRNEMGPPRSTSIYSRQIPKGKQEE